MTARTRVIYWLLMLFTGAVILDAFAQMSGKYHYSVPPEIVEFTRLGIAAALGIDIFTGVRGYLKGKQK